MSTGAVTMVDALRRYSAGDLATAAKICEELLQQDGRNADALGLLGVVALNERRFAAAAEWLARATAVNPRAPLLHHHHGIALAAMGGREADAMQAFRSALVLDPGIAEAHHQFGNMAKRLGRFDEAIASLATATRLSPQVPAVWLNLGAAQLERGICKDAIASFRRAIALAPEMPEASNILGAALLEDGQIAEAIEAFSTALRLRPAYAAAHNNRARALKAAGRLEEAVREYRSALAAAPDPATHSNLVYALNFVAGLSPDAVWAEHNEWGRRWGSQARDVCSRKDRTPGRRLRIGFVSPDLVNHAVAYFFEPLLAACSRDEWEVFCYSDVTVPDRVTQRLRDMGDHWRDTALLGDSQLDARIRQDRIDILIDMAGHTARNRLRVFARKPATLQVTWLGYPNTTGLQAMDYRVTDGIADPVGATDSWHAETLLRLPRAFLCYRPPMDSPKAATGELRGSRHRVTFASFSNLAKLSPPCVALWAEILKQVPHSRLILKSRGLGDPSVAAHLTGQFASHGIERERLELDARLVSTAEHLRLYQAVDVALDPFPYNGTTTTCEALWMGVPVLTLAGGTHVARVGASLLTHVGRPEWIADTAETYVRHAVALAEHGPRGGAAREALREQMRASPLCDAAGFASDFALALRDCWCAPARL